MSGAADEVLKEIVALTEDPALTLEALGQQLGDLYAKAEAASDGEVMAIVVGVYNRVEVMSQQTGAAIDIAAAAREAATTLQTQRDQALEAHEKLRTAIRDVDTSDEDVEMLVDQVAEDVQEVIYESGGYISYCPGCDITEQAQIPVVHDVAARFHDLITDDADGELTDALRKEIAEFMIRIVGKVDGHEETE